ncbi:MAG: copper resistance protein CopC [Chloroflexi bacterium]|nr:copper resistance protein CopC [Chloroflexota bacterium]MBP7043388.1 copper resistance protein CopC [Chloroflexota bacterium]
MKRVVRVCLLVVVLGGLVTAVFAHSAAVLKTEPANGAVVAESPPTVTAWFAEELASGESSLKVFDASGEQVDNGDGGVDLNDPDHASMVVTLPPLPNGSYTVQYHILLLDGDASDGAFAFAVGEGESVVLPAEPVVESLPTAESTAEVGGGSPGWFLGGVLVVLLMAGGVFVWSRRRR